MAVYQGRRQPQNPGGAMGRINFPLFIKIAETLEIPVIIQHFLYKL